MPPPEQVELYVKAGCKEEAQRVARQNKDKYPGLQFQF